MHASEDVKIYLIGNKSELTDEREITPERAIQFAMHNGIHKCFETSALTGDNVVDLFSCAGKELYLRMDGQEGVREIQLPHKRLKQISDIKSGKDKKKRCC